MRDTDTMLVRYTVKVGSQSFVAMVSYMPVYGHQTLYLLAQRLIRGENPIISFP